MIASRPEPEWDDEQRGLMLARAELQAGMCPNGCGSPLEETTGEGNDVWNVTPTKCLKCEALAIAAKHTHESKDVKHPQAILYRAWRRD